MHAYSLRMFFLSSSCVLDLGSETTAGRNLPVRLQVSERYGKEAEGEKLGIPKAIPSNKSDSTCTSFRSVDPLYSCKINGYKQNNQNKLE